MTPQCCSHGFMVELELKSFFSVSFCVFSASVFSVAFSSLSSAIYLPFECLWKELFGSIAFPPISLFYDFKPYDFHSDVKTLPYKPVKPFALSQRTNFIVFSATSIVIKIKNKIKQNGYSSVYLYYIVGMAIRVTTRWIDTNTTWFFVG